MILLLLCLAASSPLRSLKQRAPGMSLSQLGLTEAPSATPTATTKQAPSPPPNNSGYRKLLQQSSTASVSLSSIFQSTTASGCSCLPEWYGPEGHKFTGSCSTQPPPLDVSRAFSGPSTLAASPWCAVNLTSCSRLPYSVRNTRWLYSGRMAQLDWDFCIPAPGKSNAIAWAWWAETPVSTDDSMLVFFVKGSACYCTMLPLP